MSSTFSTGCTTVVDSGYDTASLRSNEVFVFPRSEGLDRPLLSPDASSIRAVFVPSRPTSVCDSPEGSYSYNNFAALDAAAFERRPLHISGNIVGERIHSSSKSMSGQSFMSGRTARTSMTTIVPVRIDQSGDRHEYSDDENAEDQVDGTSGKKKHWQVGKTLKKTVSHIFHSKRKSSIGVFSKPKSSLGISSTTSPVDTVASSSIASKPKRSHSVKSTHTRSRAPSLFRLSSSRRNTNQGSNRDSHVPLLPPRIASPIAPSFYLPSSETRAERIRRVRRSRSFAGFATATDPAVVAQTQGALDDDQMEELDEATQETLNSIRLMGKTWALQEVTSDGKVWDNAAYMQRLEDERL